MITLGIEGTAHTFAAAILEGKKVIADARDSYTTQAGGIVPKQAAEHHKTVGNKIIMEAFKQANIELDDIHLIAFSNAPGMPPCLRTTRDIAVNLSINHDKKIIGVNHAIAHLMSGHLFSPAKNPVYLYVSGANTQIISLEGNRFRILGETLDTAIGNSLDKFARELGLGFPGGPIIEELAKDGKYIELPYIVKGMDLSFAGILTNAIRKHQSGSKKEDLCFSMQETCFSMLAEVTERALAHTRKDELVLIGGVAANKRLIEMLAIMCKERQSRFYTVPLKYSGDQAVMIAYLGYLMSLAGSKQSKQDIYPYQRADEVEITWTDYL